MRLRLLVSEAWRSLAANFSTTFAATVTVLVGMFILGLFIAVFTLTDSYANHVKRQLVVHIDFKTGPHSATRAQENAVARMLEADPQVNWKKTVFIPRAQALKNMRKQYPALTEQLPWNPFPDSFSVTATNASYLSDIQAKFTHPLPAGVGKVEGAKKLRSVVLRFAHVIDIVFLIGALVLVIASTLLIGNTIRLSIFSRRREIEVMKLVGATNWFVRGPFMIEGLLCGGAGALLAILFLVLGKQIALPAINYHGFSDAPDVHAWSFPLTALILLGMGLGLGALGSGLTLRRFLKSLTDTVVVEVGRRGKLLVGEPYFTAGVPIILDTKSQRAQPGDLALVRPGRGRAKIEQTLGSAKRIENVLEALLVEQGVRVHFRPEPIPSPSLEGRTDLRDLPTYTIDPEGAKDFDDALSFRRENGGIRAWVHIADVSYFVQAGSRDDRGAARRAFSTYVPGLVAPMLPPELADDACSLVPHQDRLCVTVEMPPGDGEPLFYRR